MMIHMTEPVVLSPVPTDLSWWHRAFIEPFFETYFFLFKRESHTISPYLREHITRFSE